MDDLYPYAPGAMGLTAATLGTSEDAAKAIAPNRKHLILIAMRTLQSMGAATRFEAIAASGMTVAALQPRFSEMIALGLAEPTGTRRPNPETGKGCAEMRLTDKGRARLEGGGA